MWYTWTTDGNSVTVKANDVDESVVLAKVDRFKSMLSVCWYDPAVGPPKNCRVG